MIDEWIEEQQQMKNNIRRTIDWMIDWMNCWMNWLTNDEQMIEQIVVTYSTLHIYTGRRIWPIFTFHIARPSPSKSKPTFYSVIS